MAKSFECENHILNVCIEKVPEDTHVHLMTKDEWNEKVLFQVK